MFQLLHVEKIKTRFLCSLTFFLEICAVYEIMWKIIVRTDDNMAHAHFMLDT
jgi:hypothetical protein